MSRILVVDDKEMMRDSVATTLSRHGHTVVSAASGAAAMEKLKDRPFDAIITDLQMPGMDGLELLSQIRSFDEQIPVVLMTAFGSIETAVAAIQKGAYDYITKPFNGDTLIVTIERAIEHSRLVKENQVLKCVTSATACLSDHPHELIGSSPAMERVREELARIANSHGTVLITGESGAGKEVAARWIHEHSPRAGAPFLALNCAALSTSLLESELFGHEKGAFTGADKLRKGRFELADGGTLLLDEISEIAPPVQAKLLRVLQEQSFERVGASTSRKIDVRVIATSNRNLPTEVEKGSFRQDLYYRLNVLPLRMPSLREHREDIAPLAAHFVERVSKREGKTTRKLEDAALHVLAEYDWPGNVRELQNICERAAVLTSEDTIRAGLIEPWLGNEPVLVTASERMPVIETMRNAHDAMTRPLGAPAAFTTEVKNFVCDGQRRLEDIERDVIVATLKQHNGHRQRSAAALGIGVRTLGLKLKKWKEEQVVAADL